MKFLQNHEAMLILDVNHDEHLNLFYGGDSVDSQFNSTILNILVAR